MGFEVEGFDELIDSLNELSDNVRAIEGTHDIPLTELMPDSFILAYTNCETLHAFFEQSGFNFGSSEAFAAIPEEDMDRYVSENSSFDTWEALLEAATKEYITKKLEL